MRVTADRETGGDIVWAPTWLEEVDSTQLELKRRWAQRPDLAPGTVFAARRQTAGRGRHGRAWISGVNRNLCFSLLWPLAPDGPPAAAATLAAALAVDDLLQARGIPSRPKWPNDVLVGERKICGILAEILPGEPAALALGIGLNVNLEAEALTAIGRPATSMREETGQVYDLPPLLEEALRALTPWLSRWARLGFAGLRVAWELRSQSLGQPIGIHQGADLVRGRVAGYGPAGELLLETAPGRVQAIWSGEIVEPGAGAVNRTVAGGVHESMAGP